MVFFYVFFFFFFLTLSVDFFQSELFQTFLSGTLSESQTICIQRRPNVLSVLIWVQTLCKSRHKQDKSKGSRMISREKHQLTELAARNSVTQNQLHCKHYRTVLSQCKSSSGHVQHSKRF